MVTAPLRQAAGAVVSQSRRCVAIVAVEAFWKLERPSAADGIRRWRVGLRQGHSHLTGSDLDRELLVAELPGLCVSLRSLRFMVIALTAESAEKRGEEN